MRYKGSLQKIDKLLWEYKQSIDDIVTARQQALQSAQAVADKNKDKWRTEYAEQFIKDALEAQTTTYRADIVKAQEKANTSLNEALGHIEQAIKDHFSKGLRPEFATRLTAYNDIGVNITAAEMNLLAETCESYAEARLLSEYVNGQLERKNENQQSFDSEDLSIAIHNAGLLRYEDAQKAFRDFAERVRFVVSDYSGEQNEIYDLLQTENPPHVSIEAQAYFVKGNHEFDNFMGRVDGILPENVRTKLTKDEVARIDNELKDNAKYPTLLREQVTKLAKRDPEWHELLSLDTRYSDMVKDVA